MRYAIAVVVLLALAVGVTGLVRHAQWLKTKGEIEKQEAIKEANLQRGQDVWRNAEKAGLLYVLGRETPALLEDDAKLRARLFEPFVKDERVYNVIFERRYRDRQRRDQTDAKYLYADRTRIDVLNLVNEERSGVRLQYALADRKNVNCVFATKIIPAPGDDNVNLGGMITVLVRAEEDNRFLLAKKPAAIAGR
ncbi:MAG TPA: hypothetical protein VGP72_09165 [Planctomycetota bacterium]|jgi:hypothetical protein